MPERLISQLAHVELLTPTPEQSLHFLTEVVGLEESHREMQSVYLRCWGDHFHHSVILTEAPDIGLGHIGWRSEGPEALAVAVERLEGSGRGEGWREDDLGHGPARFAPGTVAMGVWAAVTSALVAVWAVAAVVGGGTWFPWWALIALPWIWAIVRRSQRHGE